MFTHALYWNGPNHGLYSNTWWVTTQKDGQPWSGMPVDMFLDLYPNGAVF